MSSLIFAQAYAALQTHITELMAAGKAPNVATIGLMAKLLEAYVKEASV